MKILLSEIPDEGLDLEFEEVLDVGSLNLLSPVRATLRVGKAGSEVIVKGEITTSAGLQCSRCVKNFQQGMAVSIEVVYHPLEELKTEDKHEVKDDELDTGFYKGDEFDIGELVAEQIVLNVPMKPLCSESCKGICPKCGTDLNLAACTCDIKDIDPRFASLKELLSGGKE